MRYTIRRDKSRTYREQMADRELDAARSRRHPNSLLNDSIQRAHSRKMREMAAFDKMQSREARSARRAEYKAGKREHKFARG